LGAQFAHVNSHLIDDDASSLGFLPSEASNKRTRGNLVDFLKIEAGFDPKNIQKVTKMYASDRKDQPLC
jgi:hypothetical protein